jgi:hypothetical protein
MFTVTTVQSSTPSGAGKVTAKCNGKQRSVRVDNARTPEQNHAAAVGAVLDILTTSEQQAKLRHPSGGQRVRYDFVSEFGGKMKWSISV